MFRALGNSNAFLTEPVNEIGHKTILSNFLLELLKKGTNFRNIIIARILNNCLS